MSTRGDAKRERKRLEKVERGESGRNDRRTNGREIAMEGKGRNQRDSPTVPGKKG